MKIRDFQIKDADTCFKIRAAAFIEKFYDEIGSSGVVAGINAYMPHDFVRIAESNPTFIVEDDGCSLGFITLKIIEDTAEILFLYVDIHELKKGIGRKLIKYSEEWVRDRYPRTNKMVVDTGIPKYNQKFYEKMGYVVIGESALPFPDGPVKAVRLSKTLC